MPETEVTNPYVHWAQYLRSKDPSRGFGRGDVAYEPLIVQPRGDDFLQRAADSAEEILIDAHERDMAERLYQLQGSEWAPLLMYRRVGSVALDDTFDVLASGLPSDLVAEPQPIEELQYGGPVPAGRTLLGVIDDGIAYLNDRFVTYRAGAPAGSKYKTRFEAVWLQSMHRVPGLPPVLFGKILTAMTLDNWVNEPDEERIYKQINSLVYPSDTLCTVEQADSHGTHMLDLAGGVDPYDTTAPPGSDIVAVQLPPQVVDDTSGQQMILPIVAGLRWIIYLAIVKGYRQVVVNISFGITAGPKDGTGAFAEAMKHAFAVAELVGIQLDVVVPFGNDFVSRQVAQTDIDDSAPTSLELRLQPDDRAPSHVEMRVDPADADGDLRLGLTAPNGLSFAPASIPHGGFRDIVVDNEIVARIYHVVRKSDGRSWYLFAFAPTWPIRNDDNPGPGQVPLAQIGDWTLDVESTLAQSRRIRFEVQRGDTAPGYRARGRQAYLSSAGAHEYDGPEVAAAREPYNAVKKRDYSRLGGTSLLTHMGTNSAFTAYANGAGHFHTVGSAFARREDVFAVPSQFAAFNTRAGRGMVTAGVRADHNRVFPGLRASGVLSGSSARYSGSSAAAAVLARELARPGTYTAMLPTQISTGRLPAEILVGPEPRD